jgi:SDR family mycofactocin-dependent oxidoreductase
MEFDSQVVLITGGARGQGRSHALEFARRGANVVLCDAGYGVASLGYALATVDDLESTRREVEALGVQCRAHAVDVRDLTGLEDVARVTVEEFGRLDVALANAGVFSFGAVAEMDPAQWTDMIDVNLTGVFHTARAVIPHMLSRNYGRIIATASMAARGGFANISHYSASKWGLIGFMKSLAVETAGTGVTANVVAPTNVDTEMIQNQSVWDMFAGHSDGTREEAAGVCSARMPLGIPWIQPADVTRAVVFLASPESSVITGEVMHISAGVIAGNSA